MPDAHDGQPPEADQSVIDRSHHAEHEWRCQRGSVVWRSMELRTVRPAIVTLIDDDKDLLGSLRSLIRSYGYEVRTFVNAREFLASPDRTLTCCVVTDVTMPGMTGLELHAAMQTLNMNVPVIMITALLTKSMREQAMGGGALDVLQKPLDPAELLRLIETACTR